MKGKEFHRQKILSLRAGLPHAERRLLSLKIQEKVYALDSFRSARAVALYYPIQNEVEVWELFRKVRESGGETLFPKTKGEGMDFVPVRSPEEFERGPFGVPTPRGGDRREVSEIQCFLVPGVAFDREGYRLGFGKGFYDRALAHSSGQTIGLAFDFQIVDPLPHGQGDLRCDYVVTESRLLGRAS